MKSKFMLITVTAVAAIALGAIVQSGPNVAAQAQELAATGPTGPTGPSGPKLNGDMVLIPRQTSVTIVDQQSSDPKTGDPIDETSVKIAAGFTCKSDCKTDLTTTALAQGAIRIALQPAGFCAQQFGTQPPVRVPLDQEINIPGSELESVPVRKGAQGLSFTGLLSGPAIFRAPDAFLSGGTQFANFLLSFNKEGGAFSLDATEDVTNLPLPPSGSTVSTDLVVVFTDTGTDPDSPSAPAVSEDALMIAPLDVSCETVTAQLVRIQIGSPL
jgi:hypothetical protein